MNNIINKTMDMKDLESNEAKKIIKELIEFNNLVEKNGYKVSSWYGNIELEGYYLKLSLLNRGYDYKSILTDELDKKYPNFLLWEIYWVIKNVQFKENKTVLDIGGSCSLFSLFLAYKGLNVVAIDLNDSLVKEANKIAKKLKLKYEAVCKDAEDYLLNSKIKFDYITSICVFEHIEYEKRKRIINLLSKSIKKDTVIAFTFDYKNPSKFVDINTPDDVYDNLMNDNFKLLHNQDFYDNNKNYLIHPFYRKPIFWKYKIKSIKKRNFKITEFLKIKKYNDYTFGAIFMVLK